MATRKPSNVVPIGAGAGDPLGAALDAPVDAPALAEAGDLAPEGGRDDDDGLDRPLLPRDCPVRALGMKGQTCWYLDVQGQLIGLNPRDHGKNNITALFSPRTHLPMQYWPRWSEPKFKGRGDEKIEVEPSKIVGFKQDTASEALIGACGTAGIFDAIGRVRGRGAHEGRAGALILHCGDKVQVSQRRANGAARPAEWFDPGLIDGFVYPADAPSPRPALEPAGETAGEALLGLLSTWKWKRPLLDAMLALGFIGQGYVCGALVWRSHLFVTGGKGTGKSSLNGKDGVFDRLFGKGALRTGNASEAAVRQILGSKTIPVIFDEFEPNELNPAKTKAMIELARVASSGAEMHRGGQDHQAHEFVLKSAFQLSAILMPEMQPQDRSRFAILELEPFPADTATLDLDAHRLPALGQQLMRRMADGWPRLRETLRLYREALGAVGHTSRGQDQYGTLLACADLLLYDHVPDPDLVRHWALACRPEGLAELTEAAEEHEACLTHLATSQVQARGGDRRETVAAWIGAAERDLDGDAGVRRDLETIGLKLVQLRANKAGELGAHLYRRAEGTAAAAQGYLAVAGEHLGMSAIYRDSRWARGAWVQALARTPGAVRGIKVKFAGRSLRAVCVPIGEVIDVATGAGGAA